MFTQLLSPSEAGGIPVTTTVAVVGLLDDSYSTSPSTCSRSRGILQPFSYFPYQSIRKEKHPLLTAEGVPSLCRKIYDPQYRVTLSDTLQVSLFSLYISIAIDSFSWRSSSMKGEDKLANKSQSNFLGQVKLKWKRMAALFLGPNMKNGGDWGRTILIMHMAFLVN